MKLANFFTFFTFKVCSVVLKREYSYNNIKLLQPKRKNYCMHACSFYADSIDAVKLKIESISANQFKPNLAIAFADVKHNLKELTNLFNDLNIDLIGCSSAGEIVDENIYEKKISVLIMDINKSYYNLLYKEIREETNYNSLQILGTEIVDVYENPAVLLFTGGMTLDGDEVVNQIKKAKKSDYPIYGGMAGDDLTFEHTFSFTNNWITKKGVVALVINNDKVKVQGKCVSGWEGMGTKHQITKSKGNILYEIDGKPALEVYKNYFHFHTHFKKEVLENNDFFESITGQYPLIINRSDDYTIMRSPLVSDFKNDAIVLAGSVIEGEFFQFGIAPDFELLEKTTESFKNLKKEMPKIDAALMINCKGRHTALGPEIIEEIEAIHKLWQAPTVGFFSYGEIGNATNGTCEFHNVTCTLATLTEV